MAVVANREISSKKLLFVAVVFVAPLFRYIRATLAVFVHIALNWIARTILPFAPAVCTRRWLALTPV